MTEQALATAPDKVAVVVIHGMGEQLPMDTLRGFVQTVCEQDETLFEGLADPPQGRKEETWSKPDRVSGSWDLRRITTTHARDPERPGHKGVRADFFELHWADITADSTWGDFTSWFAKILFRNPFGCGIPDRLMAIWLISWSLTVAIIGSACAAALSKSGLFAGAGLAPLIEWNGWLVIATGLVVAGALFKSVLTAYLGDVARYVTASPRNVKIRQAARDRGIKLLEALHRTGGVPPDRRHSGIPDPGVPREARGCRCRPIPRKLATGFAEALQKYRNSQRTLFRALATTPVESPEGYFPAWLVSDLVTLGLGSALGHADFLFARSACEFNSMIRSRETLRSPPVYELGAGDTRSFMFPAWQGANVSKLHHAAAMAPVRWTNLHDTTGPWMFLAGDVVSGALAQSFGPGIVDVRVAPYRAGWFGQLLPRFFTHTLYWNGKKKAVEPPMHHLDALRAAVNVLDDRQREAWLLATEARRKQR